MDIIAEWSCPFRPEYNDAGRSARVEYSLNSDGTYTYLAFDLADSGGNML
jgi:hypothetical protein